MRPGIPNAAILSGLAALALITSSPAAAQAATCKGRLVRHAMGETCVPVRPRRVVALEWIYAENLLALGVQPAGVADIAGYNDWVKIPAALSTDVRDVGTRQQPSLEALAQLKPDLILAPKFRIAQTYGKLSAIAPTLAFDPYPTDGTTQYDEMRATFTTIAAVLGRPETGRAVLRRLETKLDQARDALERAGRKNETFVLAQAFTSGNAATMRLFTRNAMPSQILERIGLTNAWSDAPQQYGFSTLSLEGLIRLGADNFLYVVQNDDNVFAAPEVAPVWKSLPFVRSGRAYNLGGRTWLFGGPLSAEVLVDRVVRLMAD